MQQLPHSTMITTIFCLTHVTTCNLFKYKRHYGYPGGPVSSHYGLVICNYEQLVLHIQDRVTGTLGDLLAVTVAFKYPSTSGRARFCLQPSATGAYNVNMIKPSYKQGFSTSTFSWRIEKDSQTITKELSQTCLFWDDKDVWVKGNSWNKS